jgi:molybdopterin/thiamine biosynthesis adenylyltransferase
MILRGFKRCEGNIGRVIVIGCGGIGARIIPALIKMVMPGTEIYAVDPDVVERRNLVRQHFTAHDEGKFKAEVMAERYHTSEVPVIPMVGKFPEEVYQFPSSNGGMLLLGGTDSKRARGLAARWVMDHGGFYIDAGNEGSAGQVLLSGNHQLDVQDTKHIGEGWANRWMMLRGNAAFPEVFDLNGDKKDENTSCGFVLDTQTVMANQMAATIALNYAAMWLYRLPIYTLGCTFSTLNFLGPIKICTEQPLTDPRNGVWSFYPEGKSPAAIRRMELEAELKAADEEVAKAQPDPHQGMVNENQPFVPVPAVSEATSTPDTQVWQALTAETQRRLYESLMNTDRMRAERREAGMRETFFRYRNPFINEGA